MWFKQDYFQKENYGCKEVVIPGRKKSIETFRCVFFARMNIFPNVGVVHSFTWVYLVT